MHRHLHILTIVIFVFLVIGSLSAEIPAYVYPVGGRTTDDGRSILYLIHQSAPGVISLLEWDITTKESISLLPASCIPASFKMLADGSGFSFVDQGLIRIKKFTKRSPKTIELYEPIYGIMQVESIDATTFYASAKERERFGLFQISAAGTVERLLTSSQTDFRYPKKVGDTLFFIEQQDDMYRFMSINYPVIRSLDVAVSETSDFERRVQLVQAQQQAAQPLVDSEQAEVLVDFGAQPIVFLCMKSATEGFCVSYPAQADVNDIVLPCTYVKLSCFEAGVKIKWQATPLFVFNIPFELLQPGSPQRLYESIVPLLPRHLGHDIYFVSQVEGGNASTLTLDIFLFDQKTGAITQKTSAPPGQCFFAPFLVDGTIFHGFSTFEQYVAMEQIKLPRL